MRVVAIISLISSFFIGCQEPNAQPFQVTSNGESVPVYEQNTAPLSYGLDTYKYARLTYDGQPLSVQVEAADVEVGKDDWDISPHSYGIEGKKEGNKISFTIDRKGYVVIQFSKNQEEFRKRLVLFIEEPIAAPEGEQVDLVAQYGVDNTGQTNETDKIQQALDEISGTQKVLYFGPGVYKTSSLRLQSNSKIHLAKNATLKADSNADQIDSYRAKSRQGINRFIYIENAENIEVTGLGTFDGSGSEILGITFPKTEDTKTKIRLMLIVRSKNIYFNGIVLKDAGSWNTQVVGSQDITFTNCKLINNTRNDAYFGSLDGWDPDGSQRVLIQDSFGWAGDDNVAVKSTGYGDYQILDDVEDITVRRCVFLTKKTSLKIGTETRCKSYQRILFEDNDIIAADRAMGVNVRDQATVSDVVFRNNRVESVFPDRRTMPINVYITRREDDQPWTGKIESVLFENCSFETMFPKKIQISRIESHTDSDDLNVTFKNLVIEGKKINTLDPEYFNLDRTNGIISFK